MMGACLINLPWQAGWAVVRAAVPLLKAMVGGKLTLAEPAAAAWVCSALARVCGRGSQAARAYAVFVFKEGALGSLGSAKPGCAAT